MIFGLVAQAAQAADYQRNPFAFESYGLTDAVFYINNQSVPGEGFHPDYKSRDYLDCYRSLFDAFGENNTIFGNAIEREHYPNGNAIYALDLEPQRGKFLNLLKKGKAKLTIKLAKGINEPLTLVVYSRFPDLLQIEDSRVVTV